jgi:radical SAM superfamily enzyme YgiQ (UPF0313 family)
MPTIYTRQVRAGHIPVKILNLKTAQYVSLIANLQAFLRRHFNLMKILLAYLCHYQDRFDYFISKIPVGLVSLAAYLEQQGYDVTLANYSQIGHRRALNAILSIKPDLLGLSLFSHNRIDTLQLIRALKKARPQTIITVGGPHATFLADEIIARYPEIDYLIAGEGEKAFARLVQRLTQGKRDKTKIIPSELIDNLDSLPAPGKFSGKLMGIDPKQQFSFIVTSRGCSHQCVFCSSPQFWQRRVRYRSPEHIVEEMKLLHKKYGIIYFSLRDDNFTMHRGRVLAFAHLLQSQRLYFLWNCQARIDTVDEEMLIAMKRAGLEHIQYGVESGSEKILALYNKYTSLKRIEETAAITRKVGVNLSVYLMVGMAGEGRSDIAMTKALIKKIRPCDGMVSPVALYPGTALYKQEVARGAMSNDVWFKVKAPGIYLRNDQQATRWMSELILHLSRIQVAALYREKDFTAHRLVAGADCWVTDLLEGDFYVEEGNYRRARECYQRIIENHPHNPWGYLRMKKLKKIQAFTNG